MASYAPIRDPSYLLKPEEGYVFNFWSYDQSIYTDNHGSFYPSEMTFEKNRPFHFVCYPDSVIQKMTKKQYETLRKNKAIELAQIFIDNAVPTPMPVLPDEHILDNKFAYDYAGLRGLKLLKKLAQDIYQGNLLFFNPLKRYLPEYLPIVYRKSNLLMTVELEDLFITVCRGARIKSFEEFVPEPIFIHDCIRALPYELNFMLESQTAKFPNDDPLLSLYNYVVIHRTLKNHRKNGFFPSCEKCSMWAVYCLNGQLKIALNSPENEDEINANEDSAKFFDNKEEALEYWHSQKDLTKWVCSDSGCYEVTEYCCDFIEDTCHDNQSDCEDTCGSGSGSESESQSFLFDKITNTWKLK
jgi:hypothetical protein